MAVSPGPRAATAGAAAAIPGAGLVLLRLSLLAFVLMLPALGALNAQTAPASAAVKPPDPGTEELKKAEAENQKRTLADIRNLGTALFSWLTDQIEPAEEEPRAENDAALPCESPEDAWQKDLDVRDYSLISHEELKNFLVPKYVLAIPETDAWGNPYEVRLNTNDLKAKAVMSIRSSGRKGYFSGDVYKREGFDPSDFDQDIVWIDGFFVRWPKRPQESESPASKPLPIPPTG